MGIVRFQVYSSNGEPPQNAPGARKHKHTGQDEHEASQQLSGGHGHGSKVCRLERNSIERDYDNINCIHP
eukprot:1160692-Pelagomonas_calceolata.AAC.2